MNLLLMSAHTLQHYRIFNLASSLISLDQARIHQWYSLSRRPVTLQDFQSRVQLDFPGPRSYSPMVLPQPTPTPFSQRATKNNKYSSTSFSIPAFAEDMTWIQPWLPWDTGIVLILNYSYHICILRINGNSLIYTCYTLYWEWAEISLLIVSNDELDMGDNEVASSEVAEMGEAQ